MSREYSFTIILHPESEDGGYSVTVPALPGCYSQGDTIEDAIARAKEAIQLHIEGLVEDGEPIPVEAEHAQAIIVKVAA